MVDVSSHENHLPLCQHPRSHEVESVDQVSGPTIPSLVSWCSAWKAVTAWVVSWPKTPSGGCGSFAAWGRVYAFFRRPDSAYAESAAVGVAAAEDLAQAPKRP